MAGDYCADSRVALCPVCCLNVVWSVFYGSWCLYDLKSLVEIHVCSLDVLLEDIKGFVINLSFLPGYISVIPVPIPVFPWQY